MNITIEILALETDPDVKVNEYLWIERSDGRSVWRQRLRVVVKTPDRYVCVPVSEFDGPGSSD